MRKVLFIMLCVFFALTTVANSAEFYNCVDKNGNSIITDNPPQDAKCKSKGGDDESASQQQQSDVEAQKTKQDDKTTSQKGDIKKLLKIPRVGY